MSATGLRVIHRSDSAAIVNDRTEQVIQVYRGKSCHRRAEHDLKMMILGAMIERTQREGLDPKTRPKALLTATLQNGGGQR